MLFVHLLQLQIQKRRWFYEARKICAHIHVQSVLILWDKTKSVNDLWSYQMVFFMSLEFPAFFCWTSRTSPTSQGGKKSVGYELFQIIVFILVILALVIDCLSVILDIIVLAVWYPHEAKSSEQFSAVMAIFNLIFR